MRWAVVLVALGACYDAPTGPAACTITCTTDCPGDLTCKGGYCVSGDALCAPEFVQISNGAGFACAIDTLHDLWCWGSNAHHQIEPASEIVFPSAHHVGTRKWDQISAGGSHTCGISDGELLCWGANEHGQITASIIGDVVDPTPIAVTGGPATWKAVSAAFSTTCAIGDDGRLFCWGENKNGQLGNNTVTDIGAPTPVMTTLSDWTTVTQGGGAEVQHTCALSASAGLFCWGDNRYTELGDGTVNDSRVPLAIPLPNVTAVAAAGYSTCAVSAGDLYCWGYAPDGALGDPTVIDPMVAHPTPTLGSNVHGWTAVAAGSGELVCGIAAGDVYCWGFSAAGNGWGDGFYLQTARFAKVASDATGIAVGINEYLDDAMPPVQAFDMNTNCYLGGGAIRCWGDNRFGQLGQGAQTETAVPLPVAGDHAWIALATGRDHACGLDDAGKLQCWGSTLVGAIDGRVAGTQALPCASPEDCDPGAPRDVAPASALAIGSDHTCVLDVGVVRCWGDNSYTQLGAASVGPAPIAVASLSSTFTDLYDVRGFGQCARTASDTQCWGNYAAVTVVNELANMQTIGGAGTIFDDGVGTYKGFGCALGQNQQLFCFGDNSLGQFGNGPIKTTCGDATCEVGECESCPTDCTACTTCGDGLCNNGETTKTCMIDCGAATVVTSLGRSYTAIGVGWEFDNLGAFTCGIPADGTVECWGRNIGGMITQEIDGATSLPIAYATTPRTIPGLASCTQVAVGASHACALCNGGGDILCWGNHRHGAVGSGSQTVVPVLTPRKIGLDLPAGETWVEVQAGVGFTCARTSDDRAFCWGSNRHGALGLGAAATTLPIVVRTE